MHGDWPGLLRSKGYFWLATRHDIIALWSQAGGTAEYRPVGYWWASRPESDWEVDEETRQSIYKDWSKPYGDRRQELVFIGQNLPKEEMLQMLEDALLTNQELSAGPNKWPDLLADPFPDWLQTKETELAEKA